MKKNKTVFILIELVFMMIFFVATYKIITIMIKSEQEESAFTGLREIVRTTNNESGDDSKNDSLVTLFSNKRSQIIEIFSQYSDLYQQNEDFFGWIQIDDSKIDYPVMYKLNDSEFYLNHAFDMTNSKSGTPFLDGDTNLDGNLYLVYGHHMKNGTMFAPLMQYKDKAYWKNHQIIHFDTLNEKRSYIIIATFYSFVSSTENENAGFRYYEYKDLANKEIFDDYMENIKSKSLYDTEIKANYGERILVLSTCSYHLKDGRFVVVAKEIN